MVKKIFLSCLTAISTYTAVSAQDLGSLKGNFQIDAQYYSKDSLIGAQDVQEKIRQNAYLNLTYTRGDFSAGLRYESYQKPLLGFDPSYQGSGIAYRYAAYNAEKLQVTVGNFYEQFGSGLVFRSYEERALGIDNAMEGIRFKFAPTEGIWLTGIFGKQRDFWGTGEGLVRAGDIDVNLNDLISGWQESDMRLQLGGSVVSKYQDDQDPMYNLPENVAAGSVRMNMSYGNFTMYGEYAQKANDPSIINGNSYNTGSAAYMSFGYSQKGLGMNLGVKRIDNMSFRSSRSASGNSLSLNYLPALSKQHSWRLATLYPYATQPNGEWGLQADVILELPKGSTLGGDYGGSLAINYSRAQSLDTTKVDNLHYDSPFFSFGKETYFQDLNIEWTNKWSSQLKSVLSFITLVYNKDVIEGVKDKPAIYANIVVAELTYRITSRNAIRAEMQYLSTKEDKKNWVFGLVEYTVAPSWFISAFDEYNIGNDDESQRLHYFSTGVVYIKDAHRIGLSYGRQRKGILCVGGVCREVPAANGLSLSISTSF